MTRRSSLRSWPGRPAPVACDLSVRHLDRGAGDPQVSHLRPGSLGKMAASAAGRATTGASPRAPAAAGRPLAPAGQRHRAALPDRHRLRLLPHRVRPLNPPADPPIPSGRTSKGLVGNQYTRISEIMVSGMPSNTLEWQMFAHAGQHFRHLGDPHRPDQQPRHHQRPDQHRAAPDLRQ